MKAITAVLVAAVLLLGACDLETDTEQVKLPEKDVTRADSFRSVLKDQGIEASVTESDADVDAAAKRICESVGNSVSFEEAQAGSDIMQVVVDVDAVDGLKVFGLLIGTYCPATEVGF